MKRRIGTFLLAAALLQTLLPTTVLAAEADNIVAGTEFASVGIPVVDDPSGDTIDGPENTPNASQAAGADNVVDDMDLTYVALPRIDPRYPFVNPIDNSENDPNAVQAADERAVKCIDRLKLPQFAIDFYHTLESESKPSSSSGLGRDGVLIDPSQSPYRHNYSGGTAYVLPISYPTEDELRSSGFQFANLKDFIHNCMLAAYYAFDRDHPEIFWLDGYYSSNNTSDRTFYVTLAYEGFPADKSDHDIRAEAYQNTGVLKKAISTLNESVASIVSKTDGMSSNYDKIAYFNEWLTTNNQYNYTVAFTADRDVDKNIYESIGALTTKDGRPGSGRIGVDGPVCSGYARAFMLLCQQVNITCVLVDGANHMWNYVQVDPSDPRFYAVDVTWNDPLGMSGQPSVDEYTSLGANSNRETTAYTLVGASTLVKDSKTETFLEQHPEENTVSNPNYVHAIFKMGPELNDLAYVDSVVITGLDAPEAGAVPDTSVTLTSNPKSDHHPEAAGTREVLTGPVVTWSPVPADGVFAADTDYTATVTYTPLRQGYGLTAADASKIMAADAAKVTVNEDGAIQVFFSGGHLEADDFTCNIPEDLIYDGSSKTVLIQGSISSSVHNGYYTLAFTDEQNNPVTDLVKPGTYHVLAKISAHDGYEAREVGLGSVTIWETSGPHGKAFISNGTIYISPDPGYQLSTLQAVRADNGQQVPLSGAGNVYTFTMPASDVTVQAAFTIS